MEEKSITEEKAAFPHTLWRMGKELWTLRWLLTFLLGLIYLCQAFTGGFLSYLGTNGEYTVQTIFKNAQKEFNETENQLLSSLSAWFGIPMSLGGGIMIDYVLGLRLTFWIAQLMSIFVAVVFALGVQYTNYSFMIMSSVFSGSVSAIFAIGSNLFLVKWFKFNRGLSFSLGLSFSISRLFQGVQASLVMHFTRLLGVKNMFWLDVLSQTCILFICSLICLQDWIGERKSMVMPLSSGSEYVPNESLFSFIKRIISAPLRLSRKTWILASIVCFDMTISCKFFMFVKNFIQVKYGYSMPKAIECMAIYHWCGTCCLIVFSLILEILGYYSILMVLCGLSFITLHSLFLTTMIHPKIFMAFLGSTWGIMAAAVWPSIQFVTADHLLGTANGTVIGLRNLTLAAVGLISGIIIDKYRPIEPRLGVHKDHIYLPDLKGFQLTECIYIPFAFGSVVSCLALIYYDLKSNTVLSISASKRLALLRKIRDDITLNEP